MYLPISIITLSRRLCRTTDDDKTEYYNNNIIIYGDDQEKSVLARFPTRFRSCSARQSNASETRFDGYRLYILLLHHANNE